MEVPEYYAVKANKKQENFSQKENMQDLQSQKLYFDLDRYCSCENPSSKRRVSDLIHEFPSQYNCEDKRCNSMKIYQENCNPILKGFKFEYKP
jgi:hypothetical protein